MPYWSINTGAAGIETLPSSLQSRQAFDVLAQDFSVGGIAPARIPVSGEAEAKQITDAIAGDPRFGTPVLTEGVLDVPVNAPATSEEAVASVRYLRTVADSPVGGDTSLNADYFDIVDQYLPIVIGIVLLLSFVVLLIAFRSIVVPFVAILMNLLSVGAAYGLLVLVMQRATAPTCSGSRGRHRRGVDPAVPVQRAVRPLDGLPRVPAHAGSASATCRPATPTTPSPSASRRRPA